MMQPIRYENNECKGLVCKLKKTIYGLKQVQRIWNERIDSFLLSFGFKRCQVDPIIYYFDNEESSNVFLALYVYDLLLFSKYPLPLEV
jgi:D-serine dehydratase